MSTNWTAFYRSLEGLRVELPALQVGEPVSLRVTSQLLIDVHNKRTKADKAHSKIIQLLAEARRKLQAAEYQLQSARSLMLTDTSLRSPGMSKAEHANNVDAMLAIEHKAVSRWKSARDDLDLAKSAVEAIQRTLQLAKETLNAVARAAESEMQ